MGSETKSILYFVPYDWKWKWQGGSLREMVDAVLRRSFLLSCKHWWIEPGRGGAGRPFWAGREAAPLRLPVPHCFVHRGITFVPGKAGDFFITVLVGPDGGWQMQTAGSIPAYHAYLVPLMSWVQHTHFCWQHAISAGLSPCPALLCLLLPVAEPVVQHTSPSACACTPSVLHCPFGYIPNPIFLS